MKCVACGRELTNALDAPNQAHWTSDPEQRGARLPYCGDSADCQHDAEYEAQR